jgi:1A family penicillin-binding protein
MAILMERKYTKKQILELYLNQIYFGHGAYGIEVAAQTYFNKHASELDLAESALLAGLPKAPNTYSPFNNWEEAKKRQQTVLSRMVETGLITKEEADEAVREKLVFKQGGGKSGQAPYFVNEIIKYITDEYEDGAQMLFAEGISVYTTLDLGMQKAAEDAFSSTLDRYGTDIEGALVAIDPSNGHVKAMVGGRDFSRSKFNRTVQAHRQPGSAFKPFLYTSAIDMGYTQATTLACEPVEFPQGNGQPYKPTDYGQQSYHYRDFTLKEALAVSDNVVAVKLARETGPSAVADFARRMGIKSDLRPYLSIALGTSEVTPLELTSAYGTLASNGIRTEPLMITKITDRNGKIIEENDPIKERVLKETTAYLVTDMLTGVLQPGGTAGSVSGIISRPAAGKTGTTQNYRDAWFVGYTPELTAGIYIGYDDPKRSVGISGGKIAAPIWTDFIKKALEDTPPSEFPVPYGITREIICSDSGLLATPYSPNTIDAAFIRGTEPKQYCSTHSFPEREEMWHRDFFDWIWNDRYFRP